jgi:beta-galactosidase
MHWREHVRANGETRVDAQFGDAWPAVLSHGNVRYIAAWLSHGLHRAVLQQAAKAAGIETQLLADGLRIRRRGDLTFAFNFGEQQVQAPAPVNATFVLGQQQLATGDVCAWR